MRWTLEDYDRDLAEGWCTPRTWCTSQNLGRDAYRNHVSSGALRMRRYGEELKRPRVLVRPWTKLDAFSRTAIRLARHPRFVFDRDIACVRLEPHGTVVRGKPSMLIGRDMTEPDGLQWFPDLDHLPTIGWLYGILLALPTVSRVEMRSTSKGASARCVRRRVAEEDQMSWVRGSNLAEALALVLLEVL